MKILFYGAGVIGSLYAAKLASRGHDITMLARGERLRELRNAGLVIEHALTWVIERHAVRTVERLSPGDLYDLIVVCMRRNQVDGVLPALAENVSPAVLFMVNTALGYDEWLRKLGKERVVIGFPAAGGSRKQGIIEYYIPEGAYGLVQSTTVGEPDGRKSDRIRKIARMFGEAGFGTKISRNMDAWQKTHVSVVTPMAQAVHSSGTLKNLSASSEGIERMLRDIRRRLTVLKKLGIHVTPGKLNIFFLPIPILVPLFSKLLSGTIAETVVERHALAARDETECLARELARLEESGGESVRNEASSYGENA